MVTRIKPYNPRAKDLVADWHVIDASGEVLGRLASRVAWLLMGKHKPGYVRHLSSGDFVVVVNAQKVRTTGKKSEQIVYRRHSQYPGNLKEIPYQRVMDTHPTRIIEHAVRGMLPKSKLGDRMYTRLKVYAEETHPHVAQLTGSQRRIERLAAEATRVVRRCGKGGRSGSDESGKATAQTRQARRRCARAGCSRCLTDRGSNGRRAGRRSAAETAKTPPSSQNTVRSRRRGSRRRRNGSRAGHHRCPRRRG